MAKLRFFSRFNRRIYRKSGYLFALLVVLTVGTAIVLRQAFLASGVAVTYYVAPTGNDGHSGTFDSPFRTVQKCVNVALAGDTCLLRGGTYAEDVVFPRSGVAGAPITVSSYAKETATVTAADPVTGWTLDHGRVYRSHVATTLGDTHDQLFVDGQMMPEAQLPNTSPSPNDISNPTRYKADTATRLSHDSTGSVYRFTDSELTAPAGSLVNAQIEMSVGLQFTSCGAVVVANAPGSIDFKPDGTSPCSTPDSGFEPRAGNPYVIYPGTSSTTNRLALLDAPGEWVYDSASGNLYAWLPDGSNPANHQMAEKRRTWVFDTGDHSYIDIDLLNTFAGGINMGFYSSHNTLSRLYSQYIDQYRIYQLHFVFYDPDPNHQNYMPSQEFHNGSWHIGGSNHIIRDSEIAYAAGNGITLMGNGVQVSNVVVHDVAYATNSYSAVNMRGSNHSLSHSTLYNAAERLVDMTGKGLDISYNDESNYMIQFSDGGANYAADIDMAGSRIHHNVIHDCHAQYDEPGGLYGCIGDYGDNTFQNAQFDHEIIYNTTSPGGMFFGNNSGGNTVANISLFHNTVYAGGGPANITRPLSFPYGPTITNIRIKNNIFNSPLDPSYIANAGSNLSYSNNINAPTDPKYVSPSSGNFQLQSGSPAINAGQNLGAVSNPFAGGAPDIGAIESGLAVWKFGATVDSDLLARTNLGCASAVAGKTTTCTFTLLNHRALADNLKFRVGANGPVGGSCSASGSVVTCSSINVGTVAGAQPVFASTDNVTWEDTRFITSVTATATGSKTTTPGTSKAPAAAAKPITLQPTAPTATVASSSPALVLLNKLIPGLADRLIASDHAFNYLILGAYAALIVIIAIAYVIVRRIHKEQLEEQRESRPIDPGLLQ